MTTLFLLAHQDDEIGVFHKIAAETRRGGRALCVYMTNGAWAGVSSDKRNAESLKTLKKLGVAAQDVSFLGTTLSIPDGRLVECLERCFDGVCGLINDRRSAGMTIEQIVVHAWEGGHQDHDAGHLLGVALADHFGLMRDSRQFPLYRRADRGISIAFATPLQSNGAIEAEPIPLRDRFSYLRLLINYRSQIRVVLRLLPHLLRDYAASGTQKMQGLSLERVHELPNAPPMLYEVWKLYTHADFQRHAQPFLDRHLTATRATDRSEERPA